MDKYKYIPTFGSEIFRPLQFIHGLQRFRLLMCERLLVIVFTGSTYTV